MASFSDMNAYLNSAREAQDHLESYKNDIVASKVGDIRERYEAAINKIGAFGQATTGASTAFHLGRKIYKKQKEKFGKDPQKEKKGKEEKVEGEDEPVPEGVTEFKNPAFDPESVNETHELSKEPTRTEPNEGEGNEPEIEGGTKHVTEEDIPEGAGGGAEGTDVSGLGGRGGLSAEDAKKFTQGDTEEADDLANNVSGQVDEVANAVKNKIGSSLDGAGDAASSALQGFKKAGTDMLENAGTKIAEKVGFDVAGAALDAIPIVGEVAGVAQIFHGLFKEHTTRKKEEKKEDVTEEGIRTAGGVAVGGIDTALEAGRQTVGGLV